MGGREIQFVYRFVGPTKRKRTLDTIGKGLDNLSRYLESRPLIHTPKDTNTDNVKLTPDPPTTSKTLV